MELMYKTIGDCLTDRAEKSPAKQAVVYWDKSYTWSEIDQISDYLAVRMSRQGIGRGTHAGIWSVNTPNWILTFLALEKLGAVPVLINTCYKEEELRRVICYADITYIFYGDGYKSLVYEPVAEQLRQEDWSRDRQWISIGRAPDRGWLTDQSFTPEEKQKGAIEQLKTLRCQVKPEDIAGMLFTSGTTSASKGVMLTHINLVNSALGTLEFTQWTDEDRFLLAVPLFHCFGITSNLLVSIHAGSTLYLVKYFKTLLVMEAVDKYQITVLNGVPSMFLAMICKPEFRNYSLKSLRSGIVAGSPISEKEYRRIAEKIPDMALLPSYGQTESSPCVTLMMKDDPAEKRAVTAGRLIDKVELKICDQQTSEELPAGKTGEIVVRGYNVMQGYYKLQEATEKTILPGGWLRTGDLGYLDEDGYLCTRGRIREMIIRAGENISPFEIETYILELPNIRAVKVIGIPAEVVQEKIIACVIPKPGMAVDEKQIILYLTSRLAHYKVPSHVVEVDRFPVTASGKIMLSELKRQVIEKLEKQN